MYYVEPRAFNLYIPNEGFGCTLQAVLYVDIDSHIVPHGSAKPKPVSRCRTVEVTGASRSPLFDARYSRWPREWLQFQQKHRKTAAWGPCFVFTRQPHLSFDV